MLIYETANDKAEHMKHAIFLVIHSINIINVLRYSSQNP